MACTCWICCVHQTRACPITNCHHRHKQTRQGHQPSSIRNRQTVGRTEARRHAGIAGTVRMRKYARFNMRELNVRLPCGGEENCRDPFSRKPPRVSVPSRHSMWVCDHEHDDPAAKSRCALYSKRVSAIPRCALSLLHKAGGVARKHGAVCPFHSFYLQHLRVILPRHV